MSHAVLGVVWLVIALAMLLTGQSNSNGFWAALTMSAVWVATIPS